MKTLISIIAVVFILMAALATPIAIGSGIYEWAVVNVEFKVALWEGFKMWIKMIVIGLVVGLPAYSYIK